MTSHEFAPYLSVSDAPKAVAFYSHIFATTPSLLLNMPDGRIMHCEFRVDGARFFLSEAASGGPPSPARLGDTCVSIQLYVEDCDAMFDKMVANGAEVRSAPSDMFWGERFARVRDPFGHEWGITTQLRVMTADEIQRSAAKMFAGMSQPEVLHPLQLLSDSEFNCADIARAVNYYVKLGETRALSEFTDIAGVNTYFGWRFNINERIGWLCRILYETEGDPVRAPMFGALELPYNTMPLQKWPLYPIARSGDTYCVLSEGYVLCGRAEPISDYMAYCSSNGTFRSELVSVPDRATAIRDISAIRVSDHWLNIKWTDSGPGFFHTMDEAGKWSSIIGQAEAIA